MGGGAIRGIGEKFAANPVTGAGSMSVPIATSPGRSGFGPQLSLSYDSGAGNGPFGFGWSLSLPSITRRTEKGIPRYLDTQESDVFVLSGAEDLVPVLVPDAEGNLAREKLPLRTVGGAPWPVRPDPFSTYRAGFEVRTYRICQRVLMFHHFPGEVDVERNCLVRSTDFTYSDEVDPLPGAGMVAHAVVADDGGQCLLSGWGGGVAPLSAELTSAFAAGSPCRFKGRGAPATAVIAREIVKRVFAYPAMHMVRKCLAGLPPRTTTYPVLISLRPHVVCQGAVNDQSSSSPATPSTKVFQAAFRWPKGKVGTAPKGSSTTSRASICATVSGSCR